MVVFTQTSILLVIWLQWKIGIKEKFSISLIHPSRIQANVIKTFKIMHKKGNKMN